MKNIKYRIDSDAVINIPWQDKPAGCEDVVWRYSANPVIDRNHIPAAEVICNSAIIPFEDGFIGVFRVDGKNAVPNLHLGKSVDGVDWQIDNSKIVFENDANLPGVEEFCYDPRLCKIADIYYVTWCNGYHGPTIGNAYTKDFKTFVQFENAFLPFNRNGVLFPKKINGNFVMLSRPSDNGHTPFGDIFVSESPDMCFWGKHRWVMGTTDHWWQGTKIGPGPSPIATDQGWLLLYHGVMTTCNGFVYSMGAALLDLDDPSKVIARGKNYLLHPKKNYEVYGRVGNVVFPCAAVCDADTGRLAIYYGSADTTTCLAFAYMDDIIDFIKDSD